MSFADERGVLLYSSAHQLGMGSTANYRYCLSAPTTQQS